MAVIGSLTPAIIADAMADHGINEEMAEKLVETANANLNEEQKAERDELEQRRVAAEARAAEEARLEEEAAIKAAAEAALEGAGVDVQNDAPG